MTLLKTLSSALAAAAVLAAAPASAALITYDVNLNFNPTQQEASPGAGSVGTITGTATIDTSIPVEDGHYEPDELSSPRMLLGVDLTEATNDGLADDRRRVRIANLYELSLSTSISPVTHIFFGSPIVFQHLDSA